jgi:hypothetical protein
MTMTREQFIAAVDWVKTAAAMRDTRAELELRISQTDAEVRANVRERDAGTQAELARYQGNIDLLDQLLATIEG